VAQPSSAVLFFWPIIEPMRFVALLFSTLLGAVALAQPQSSRTGALSGTLVDASGTPLGNVTVALYKAFGRGQKKGKVGAQLTDAQGKFTFQGLRTGFYNVLASNKGFRTADLRGVLVKVDKESKVRIGMVNEKDSPPYWESNYIHCGKSIDITSTTVETDLCNQDKQAIPSENNLSGYISP
jgi:hypothetical protein